MAEVSDMFGIIYQKLVDLDCSEKEIITCMKYVKNGELKKILPLLTQHKKELLNKLHICQEQIDNLDFLIYQIKK